jgi:hypothetical protein
VDFLLEVVEVVETLMLGLAVQAARVLVVWFVFILGNQL